MGLWAFSLVLCLLLTAVSVLGQFPQISCSAKNLDRHGGHLNATAAAIHLPVHHAHGPCSPTNSPSPPTSAVLRHDDHRVAFLLSRLTKPNTSTPHASDLLLRPSSAAAVPVTSGLSVGVGNYIAKLGLGTPSRQYLMVVDTGSSLSWLQCAPCKVSCHDQQGPVFDPAASSSFSFLPCSAGQCTALQDATLNPSGCSRQKVCVYQATYGDNSYSIGYMVKDTLSFGSAAVSASAASALPGFVFGCGQDNQGLFGRAAGLIGLGRDSLSMVTQLAPKYGKAFTYCLPTAASSGYLSIGSYSPSEFAFTPMVSSPSEQSLYFVRLVRIMVANRPIRVSAASYGGMRTIIDSGTVITRLPPEVLTALSNAVVRAMPRKPRAPGFSILETCFSGTYGKLPVPEVRLVFAGGAEMKLAPRNVFYDLSSGKATCLAFARASSIAIIGNRQQQTFKVAYDVAGSRIGFAAGGCS